MSWVGIDMSRPGVIPFESHLPDVADDAFVAPGAWVIGRVTMGPLSSVWYNTVVRGDEEPIHIGARSNIQDGSVIHTSSGRADTWIGDNVLVGHMCIIHGCRLEDRAFVGMGATVLDHAVIEPDAMLAAGALLTPGKRIPSGELWAGRPAKFMRKLSDEDIANNARAVEEYVRLAVHHRETMLRTAAE
jgi:carbonic anhydrase/acetyltransferase-like protein (isoleucine patch superfamily)